MKTDKDGHPVLERYTANDRSNHWFNAICFILLALSGLSMFHPAMAWLAALFGGGQWTRILHPFFGLTMVVSFVLLVVRFWHGNRWEKGDAEWLKGTRDVITGHEENLPPVGHNNAGQKMVFYISIVCMLFLLLTGIVIWREWFSSYFPIDLVRLSVLLHAFFAFVMILTIIIHVYAGLWVRGSMGAMMKGTVTYGWARKHHPRWFKEEIRKGQQ